MVRNNWTRAWIGLAALALNASAAVAQEPATLSLDEALELARRNNPDFQALRNDEGVAAWSVREAYGSFLPRASVGGGMRYEDGGQALFGSFTAEDIGFTTTPAYYFSSYSAGVNLSLSGQTFFNVAQQRATRRAVEADITATEVALETAVKQMYLVGLGARDAVGLRRQELERAEANFALAEARAAAGVGIPLDAKQAQVERGRAQVALLTAESDFATSKLRLLQQLGVEIEGDVELTTEFDVFEPTWGQDQLLELAAAQHPTLRSLRATASAQRAAARTAWSTYLPSFSMSAGWSGYTRQVGSDDFLVNQTRGRFEDRFGSCEDFNDLSARLANPYPTEDCSRFAWTPAVEDSVRDAVLSSNRAFPFDFEKQPLSVSFGISLPVFQGFGRQRQVAQAQAAAEDTDHRLRGERIRLKSDVAAAYLRLRTGYQAVQIEENNRTVAQEQLELARDRYRVGLDTFIQLLEAETLKSRADQSYLAAVYSFHTALADLEAAVGQSLRPAQ